MSDNIFCVFCGNSCQVKLKTDGSSLKACENCGGNPLPMDVLLVNLDLGQEDFSQCPKCKKLDSGNNYCWNCSHKF